ncbi:hypothetical protein C8R43DRAFT_955843 [Mycena crocata]|nr:hypothetical protein C8R43DRAFT_955843 [Mycena crocata]
MAAAPIPTHESYLVLGGTSLGETIVEELLARGETRVSIFDTQPLAAEQAARFGASVRVCIGDILVLERVVEAIQSCGTTCIIHTGTMSSPISSAALYPDPSNPPRMVLSGDAQRHTDLMARHKAINTDGMRIVLTAALNSGIVRQVLYIGAADVVFDGTDRPMLRESDAPHPATCWVAELEPRSHAERMVLSFNGVNELSTAVVRPALIYGPGYATLRMLDQMQANPRLAALQIGENTNRVDKTHVANAAHAAILAADRLAPAHPQHSATAGQVFFVSDGDPRPFWDYNRALWAAAGGAPPKPVPAVGSGMVLFIAGVKDMVGNLRGEKREWWRKTAFMCASRSYDISLAREVLGYAPIVSHDEGIRRTAEWWLARKQRMKSEKHVVTAESEVAPPPYEREEAAMLAEKSPFF